MDQRNYDANGNLTGIDQNTLTYDYRNQMVEYIDASSTQRHTYAYDVLGRRVAKVLDADSVADETRYFYQASQVLEEQDNTANILVTYIYGLYVDEVLNMERLGTNYYYHADDLYNVVAVSDTNGAVVERYAYDDYGQPTFLNQSAISIPQSEIRNSYFFTGWRYNPETEFFYYRTRYLDPKVGRFTTRDTIGVWGDSKNVGNGYTYVGNAPISFTDPYGEVAPLVVAAAVWVVIETGLTLYDIYDAVTTAADPCASALDKSISIGGLALGVVLPGGGYRLGGKAAVKKGPVIIGETMERVKEAAAKIPGAKILDDMPDFRAIGMEAHEVTSAMMQYNRKWILKQMRSGREIIDIGADASRKIPT
ncbi:MAG: hypothetical protein GKR87_03820 [Kiritimatiellae bacterium]|nr:hypothetical protein [Kiritimatiellia bacterium]